MAFVSFALAGSLWVPRDFLADVGSLISKLGAALSSSVVLRLTLLYSTNTLLA
jgi:hypothetical protein